MKENKTKYNFQYCQKIVIFSRDWKKVLLAKRKGEADLNETYTFIGGKMEMKDSNPLEGLEREKNEEAGESFKIKLYPVFTTNAFYLKKDGSHMILPHYLAVHESGEVKLNDEYSDYRWVPIKELDKFEPKIETIPATVKKMLLLKKIARKEEFMVI
jgi:8-oxo-dGTP diphosphatase